MNVTDGESLSGAASRWHDHVNCSLASAVEMSPSLLLSCRYSRYRATAAADYHEPFISHFSLTCPLIQEAQLSQRGRAMLCVSL